MKETHPHGIEQRPLEVAEHRPNEFGPRTSTEPLGTSESKGTFNYVQDSPLQRLASHK